MIISEASPQEHKRIGQLMVEVYSNLSGFPSQKEQPSYYQMLASIGDFAKKESVELLSAKEENTLLGAVVFIGDMKEYGSGGSATHEKDAAGFRLLAVSNEARGKGIGKLLSIACIDRAKAAGRKQMIIHTTDAMDIAWKMYEKLGFERSDDLDFSQQGLPVYGFRLAL